MRIFRFLPAAALFFAAAAHAEDMPHRKAGLWSVTMTMQGGTMPTRTTQMCVDAASDAAMMNVRHGAQTGCDKPSPRTAGNVTTIDFQCTRDGSHETMHMVFTRQSDDAYHMEIHSHADPAMHGQADTVMVQDAKWVGPCTAGMSGGDMIMPGGMKINILHPAQGARPH